MSGRNIVWKMCCIDKSCSDRIDSAPFLPIRHGLSIWSGFVQYSQQTISLHCSRSERFLTGFAGMATVSDLGSFSAVEISFEERLLWTSSKPFGDLFVQAGAVHFV